MAKKGKKGKNPNPLLTALAGAAVPTIAFIGKRIDDAAQSDNRPDLDDPKFEERLEEMVDRAVQRALAKRDKRS